MNTIKEIRNAFDFVDKFSEKTHEITVVDQEGFVILPQSNEQVKIVLEYTPFKAEAREEEGFTLYFLYVENDKNIPTEQTVSEGRGIYTDEENEEFWKIMEGL